MTDLLFQAVLSNICISLVLAVGALVAGSAFKRPQLAYLLWWNPLVWWARRHLRAAEEICCDHLVISSLNPAQRSYADALLNAIEYLASPVIRRPMMASEITSGGYLKRRFKMILSKTNNPSTSRWMQICVLLLAVAILPLGLAIAGDSKDSKPVRAGIKASIESGQQTTTRAEVRKSGERDEGIESHFKRIGVSPESLEKIRAALKKGGLTEEQSEQALGGMLRVAFEIKSKGADFELNPRIKSYFQENVGLNEEQTTLVVRLSRRISGAIPDRGRGGSGSEGYQQAVTKIKEAIASGEITEEEGRARFDALRRRMAAQENRPSREEMGAVKKRIWAGVEDGTITEEQAEKRWQGYLEHVKGSAEQKRIIRKDMVQAGLNIRKAVAEGKLTEEEGRAKMEGMRKRMAAQRARTERERGEHKRGEQVAP